jgi:ATP-dependent Zn protease
MAYEAVRRYGMFGEDAGYVSVDKKDSSQERNALIDDKVKQILDESYKRVEKLLQNKDSQLRELSKNLYWHDYLDDKEIFKIMNGEAISKEKVREWTDKDNSIIKF